MKTFQAYVVRETATGFCGTIESQTLSTPQEGSITVKVEYSSINYKDYLSATGNKGITKQYPHIPGIDAAGTVELSNSPDFKIGEKVVVMGYDLGMNTNGGWGEYITVPAAWVVKLPKGLSAMEVMSLGTAGFTAALGIYKLKLMEYLPYTAPVLVTGATGGVGSIAVHLLSKLGYEVTAVSGKPEHTDFLLSLGAKNIIGREELSAENPKPMSRPAWGAAFDAVGGVTLVNILKALHKNGTVVTCGSVSGTNINMTVFPFILNGINLLGINAADTAMSVRQEILHRLANDWKPNMSQLKVESIGLHDIDTALEAIKNSSHTGRFVVDLQKGR